MHGLKFPRPRRNYWKSVPNSGTEAIKNFSPQFFTICMGTGILSVLLHQNSYQFKGLEILSTIVWIIDLLFFSLISILFLTRWIRFPGLTAKLFETDVEQTTYLSTTTIALATLLEITSLTLGSRWDHWDIVCFSFWWFTVLWSLGAGISTYWLLIRDETVAIDNLVPTLLYPTTGLLATSSAGSVIVNYTPLSVNLSMPVIVVSYLLLGAGFFLMLLTLSAYFLRLLHNQTPSPKKVGAQLIPIAPLSNAAYAFTTLGYLAGPKKRVFELYGKGPITDPAIGSGLYATGFIFGLLLWGFATLWLILCLVALVRDLPKTRFNINMWSSLYPFGAYGVASSQFAIDFDSTAFSVITSIILVVLVIYWLYVLVLSIPLIVSGQALLEEVVEEKEKQEREDEKSRREEREEMERDNSAAAIHARRSRRSEDTAV